MENGISYKLEGVSEVLDTLDALSSKEITALVRSANRKALSSKIVPPLRSALSEFGPNITRGIKVMRDYEYKDTGMVVGPTTDIFWVRFLVKGTKIRTTKEGWNRGKIEPNDSAIRAIESNIPGVIEFFNKEFGETLISFMQKRIKRLSKK